MKKNIPIIWEREGNKKTIPKIREREGNEKIHPHNLGKGEAFILGNGREREIPLTPDLDCVIALVKAGADISLLASDGSQPIHAAAEANNVEMVQVLLEHGNTPDTVSSPF